MDIKKKLCKFILLYLGGLFLLFSCMDENNIENRMLLIREGDFIMGDNYYNFIQQRIYLDNYLISQYPITVEEYRRFCKATEKPFPQEEVRAHKNTPIFFVSWYDAIDYCNWRSRNDGFKTCYFYKDGYETIEEYIRLKGQLSIKNYPDVVCIFSNNGYRLPTEAEWEKAARGTSGRLFPWGNLYNPLYYANADSFKNKPAKVGYFEKDCSIYGVYDMMGNGEEWCNDTFDKNYFIDLYYQSFKKKKISRNPKGPFKSEYPYIKSYRSNRWDFKAIYADSILSDRRDGAFSYGKYKSLGFRVVRSIK